MAAQRFCSECGERLKLKRGPLRFWSFCSECAPRFRRTRLMWIAFPVLCSAIGFATGHYTSKPEPFYYIGTPIDSTQTRVAPAIEQRESEPSHRRSTSATTEAAAISSAGTESICGARTKSGKPCQRKVKGGGYCWQHRDKMMRK